VEPERFEVSEATAAAVRRARREGGRVVAVGTTTARVLETVAERDGGVNPGAGWTDLTIVPGHEFRVIDALLTNFHLPRSSLLLLVSAFAGRERVLAAYAHAVDAGYRFYSYGDAMLIGLDFDF
jgi:S-adenosylmethionine:tRNA ribosyltransferase-isomerase